LINDVPDGPGDRRTNGPRTIAAIVAALAATLLAAAIAGCGGGGSESSSTSTSASVTTTPTTSTHTTPTTSTATSTAGGSSGGQVGQHLSIPQVVELVLTSSDPAKVCGSQYVTQHYLGVAYGGKQGCVQAQDPKSTAISVHVDHVISLDSAGPPPQASAEAAPNGGIYDGEKVRVSLVKEDGSWKVDGLKSNAPVGP
jgi:hypothetical protein